MVGCVYNIFGNSILTIRGRSGAKRRVVDVVVKSANCPAGVPNPAIFDGSVDCPTAGNNPNTF